MWEILDVGDVPPNQKMGEVKLWRKPLVYTTSIGFPSGWRLAVSPLSELGDPGSPFWKLQTAVPGPAKGRTRLSFLFGERTLLDP